MSILVVSSGRSGSGWLTSVMVALGLSGSHEWMGSSEANPDVIADTSWLWNQEEFFKGLRAEDSIIVLDRSAAQRTASVERLLGKRDWAALNDQWDSFKAKLQMLDSVTWVGYDELFVSAGKEKIFKHMWYHTGHATDRFEQVWQFMRNMRVTNKRAEQECMESYGVNNGQ